MGRAQPRQLILKSGETVVVRSAEPADAAPLVAHVKAELATAEFTVTQHDEFTRDEAKERELIEESIAADGRLILIALAGPAIVGNLYFKNHPRRRMAHHGTFGIGVADGWRGRGIGRVMITSLLDWAAADPVIEKVRLGVFTANHRAIALYRSLGFVEEYRQSKEFKLGPGRYADDISMYQWVKPVEGEMALWHANNDGAGGPAGERAGRPAGQGTHRGGRGGDTDR